MLRQLRVARSVRHARAKEGKSSRPLREAQRLSTSRLFWIVLVFLILAAYSIWNSDRFQTLFQGVSEQRLSELLQRPVHFRRVDFRMFPPPIQLADVSIANDPRIPDQPLLTADELTIGGGLSVTGGELRFGRVRAVHPRIALVQFPDGGWNLPPGLTGPPGKGTGLKVRVGELVVQQGLFEFEGRQSGFDGRLEGLAVELASHAGQPLPRHAHLAKGHAQPARRRAADLQPRLAISIESGAGPRAGRPAKVAGAFGELRLSGSVENLKNPLALLTVSGNFHVAEVERLFRSSLDFAGDATLTGELRMPPGGGFRFAGHLSAPKVDAHGFPIEGLEAAVLASPEALVAQMREGPLRRAATPPASSASRTSRDARAGPAP